MKNITLGLLMSALVSPVWAKPTTPVTTDAKPAVVTPENASVKKISNKERKKLHRRQQAHHETMKEIHAEGEAYHKELKEHHVAMEEHHATEAKKDAPSTPPVAK